MVVERGPAAPVRVGGGLEGHESVSPAATFRKAEAGHFLQVRDGVRDGHTVLLAEVALDDVGNGASAPHVAGLFSGSKKFFLYYFLLLFLLLVTRVVVVVGGGNNFYTWALPETMYGFEKIKSKTPYFFVFLFF